MRDHPRSRKSTRLRHYDYASPGMYFVTVCTDGRRPLGDVIGETMEPNEFGRVVEFAWADLPSHHAGVVPDAFVLMPNHVHGLLRITDRPGIGQKGQIPLGTIVGAFKSSAARRINALRGTPGGSVWQRGYHEHVVRGEDDLSRARRYIAENPLKWHLDRENPDLWK